MVNRMDRIPTAVKFHRSKGARGNCYKAEEGSGLGLAYATLEVVVYWGEEKAGEAEFRQANVNRYGCNFY